MRRLFVFSIAVASLACAPVLAQDAARIVAIGGSVTEIVYALGEQDRLIARDTTSIYPDEATTLPDVGYMRALSPEGVLSVDPDLILALEGAGPPETMQVLEAASVSVVEIGGSLDKAGVLDKIRNVADALGVPEKAAPLVARMEADFAAAQEAITAMGERPRVLFILSLEGGRVMASGTGTAADAMISLAGGENAVTAYDGYKQLSDEALVEAAPDAILMMDRGGDLDPHAADLSALPALAATPAVQEGRVLRMEGSYLLGFGPRTGAAMRELAEALHASTGTAADGGE